MHDTAGFAGLKITVFIPQTDCSLARGVWLQFQPAGNQAMLNLLHQLPPADRRWHGKQALWLISAVGIQALADAIPVVAARLEQLHCDFLRRRRERERHQEVQREHARDQQRLYQMLREWLLAAEQQHTYQHQQHAYQHQQQTAILASPPSYVRDAFAVLTLPASASQRDIQAARRALARQHHPDVGGSTEMMQRINNAADTCLSWVSRASRR